MDSTSTTERRWQVDIDELTAAMEQELQERKKRSFFDNISGFPFTPKVLPPGADRLWVKYHRGEPTLEGEARTQEYVRSALAKLEWPSKTSLHIPEVFDYAETEIEDLTHSFIIMEFVTGTPISHITRDIRRSADLEPQVKEDKIRPFKDRVVDALCFFLSLDPPADAAPGPVGGGRVLSFVFGQDNYDAPRDFDSLLDLQEWVNQENEKEKLNPALTTADLVSEGLRLCYCDLNLENFLLDDAKDPTSRLTIIDFQHTSWLPFSFLVWELWDKWELYMEEQITSRSGIEINRENVEALHNIRLQRRLE